MLVYRSVEWMVDFEHGRYVYIYMYIYRDDTPPKKKNVPPLLSPCRNRVIIHIHPKSLSRWWASRICGETSLRCAFLQLCHAQEDSWASASHHFYNTDGSGWRYFSKGSCRTVLHRLSFTTSVKRRKTCNLHKCCNKTTDNNLLWSWSCPTRLVCQCCGNRKPPCQGRTNCFAGWQYHFFNEYRTLEMTEAYHLQS